MSQPSISERLSQLWHHPKLRNTIARIGYHPVVERTVTGLNLDQLIQRFLFPMSTQIQVMDQDIEWTVPNIYGYLNANYSSTSNTWLEGELSRKLAEEIEPGDVVYDSGARWGYQTLISAIASGEEGTVVSFEPYTPHRKILQTTIKNNELPAAVRIESFALGDEIRTVEFDLSLNEHSPRLNPENDTSREVPMITLDAFVHDNEPPDLIDIDIEGAELNFLRGARKVLEKHQPILFLEIHDREMVLGKWEEIYDLLLRYNYKLERVGRDETMIVESPPNHDQAHDLIARPKE